MSVNRRLGGLGWWKEAAPVDNEEANSTQPRRVPISATDLKRLFLVFLAVTVLAGILGLLWPIIFWRPHPQQNWHRTMAFLQSIKSACAAYEFDWGCYPPDTAPNGRVSSEALHYYLVTPFREKPDVGKGEVLASQYSGPYLDLLPKQMRLTNIGTAIIDIWGQPIEYDNNRDDKTSPNGFNHSGSDDPRTDGRPRNVTSYDLFSRGEPGKSHPLANFEIKEETPR